MITILLGGVLVVLGLSTETAYADTGVHPPVTDPGDRVAKTVDRTTDAATAAVAPPSAGAATRPSRKLTRRAAEVVPQRGPRSIRPRPASPSRQARPTRVAADRAPSQPSAERGSDRRAESFRSRTKKVAKATSTRVRRTTNQPRAAVPERATATPVADAGETAAGQVVTVTAAVEEVVPPVSSIVRALLGTVATDPRLPATPLLSVPDISVPPPGRLPIPPAGPQPDILGHPSRATAVDADPATVGLQPVTGSAVSSQAADRPVEPARDADAVAVWRSLDPLRSLDPTAEVSSETGSTVAVVLVASLGVAAASAVTNAGPGGGPSGLAVLVETLIPGATGTRASVDPLREVAWRRVYRPAIAPD